MKKLTMFAGAVVCCIITGCSAYAGTALSQLPGDSVQSVQVPTPKFPETPASDKSSWPGLTCTAKGSIVQWAGGYESDKIIFTAYDAPGSDVRSQETATQNLKQIKADLTKLLTVNLPDNVVKVESLKVSRAPTGHKYYFEGKTIETGLVLSKRYTIKGIYDPSSTDKIELLEKTFEGAVN